MSPVLLAFFATLSLAQNKPRVAVLDFEYATVQDSVASIFGTNMDIGKGIADLLVEDLVKSGAYSVIERKAIEKIMQEQNFSNSDRADPASAAKIGQLLGVDAIILGSITQFGRDDKSTNVGGGMLGGLGGRFGVGGVGKKESKAVVAITARMVSTDTAEILAATSGKGESKRSGTSLIGTGGSGSAAGIGNVDMASSNFGQTIIGEAVNQAVDTLGTDLEQNAQRVPTRTIKVEGLVADVAGSSLILNVGTSGGVKVGDKLKVTRTTREVKDPATGKVLRRIEETLGEIAITEADETSAVGTFTGTGAVKVGDSVATAP
ncbi:MAG: curli production assembly protein CsgG [Acidobacteria bacterium RIFCSPLOWO2_12_FULL_54_10]|nr:MAG: curli production assembly protein CsgG [Acidobacteria bacterium RIFCSPLOWO2_12_FULL_54_10]